MSGSQGGAAAFTTPLPTQGFGLVDIIGQTIDFQGGTEVYAPGQNISATAVVPADPRMPVPGSGRVLLESGAILDVSGIPNTELPMAANLLTVTLAGNELADDPEQQDGPLFGASVTVDMRDSGTNSETGERAGSARPWPTWPAMPLWCSVRSARRWSMAATSLFPATRSIRATGSVINLMGGYVHYLGGMVETTA